MEALVIDWATRKLAMEDATVLRANMYSRLLKRAVCVVHITDCNGVKDQTLVPEERYGYLVGWDIMQSSDHMAKYRDHYEPVTPAVIRHVECQLEQAKYDEVRYSEKMKTSKDALEFNSALASRDHARKMQKIYSTHLSVMC